MRRPDAGDGKAAVAAGDRSGMAQMAAERSGASRLVRRRELQLARSPPASPTMRTTAATARCGTSSTIFAVWPHRHARGGRRRCDSYVAARIFHQPRRCAKLLDLHAASTKPVQRRDLGQLGKEHFVARFADWLCRRHSSIGARCSISRACRTRSRPPSATARQRYRRNRRRELVAELDQSFRDLGPVRQPRLLLRTACRSSEPIMLALHIASPRIAYTERPSLRSSFPTKCGRSGRRWCRVVTKTWAQGRKAEERDASRRERREELMTRDGQRAKSRSLLKSWSRPISISGPEKPHCQCTTDHVRRSR